MPDYTEARTAVLSSLLAQVIGVKADADPATGLIVPDSIIVDADALATRAVQGLADAGLVAVPYFRQQPQVDDYRLCRAMVSANLATIAELEPGQPPGSMNEVTNELLGECVDPFGAVAVLVATVSHLVGIVAMHYEMEPLAWWQVFCEQATRDEEGEPT